MRKSYLLKYMSFLLMLVSLVRLFFGFTMINFFSTSMTLGAVDKPMMRTAIAAIILIFLDFLAEMVSGFIGALHWDEPLKAGTCCLWGLTSLAIGLAGNLVQGMTGYGVSYVAWITGVIVPALYLLAAFVFFIAKKTIL